MSEMTCPRKRACPTIQPRRHAMKGTRWKRECGAIRLTLLPLPVLHGERVGVRGGGKYRRRSKRPPLTLALSPRKRGEGVHARRHTLWPRNERGRPPPD